MFECVVGTIAAKARMAGEYVAEGIRHGSPVLAGDPARGTVFLVDGVGGWRLTPAMARIAFRRSGFECATYLFDWHRGPRGEMLADLMCLRANRRAGLRLARIIRRQRRAFPSAPLHLLSFSGGTGVAAFAAERLGWRTKLDTLILAASALSPGYPLDRALQNVCRCYAFTSYRDRVILGIGTSLFGTVDRRFGRAAGLVGFDRQCVAPSALDDSRDRFVEIPWTPAMIAYGNCGHHTGSAMPDFIQQWIVPLLKSSGTPEFLGVTKH